MWDDFDRSYTIGCTELQLGQFDKFTVWLGGGEVTQQARRS